MSWRNSDSEERLETVTTYYETLANGGDLNDLVIHIEENLYGIIKECNERLENCVEKDRQYYLNNIERAKKLITKLCIFQALKFNNLV